MSPCVSPKNGKCSNYRPVKAYSLIFALNAVRRLFLSLVYRNLVPFSDIVGKTRIFRPLPSSASIIEEFECDETPLPYKAGACCGELGNGEVGKSAEDSLGGRCICEQCVLNLPDKLMRGPCEPSAAKKQHETWYKQQIC